MKVFFKLNQVCFITIIILAFNQLAQSQELKRIFTFYEDKKAGIEKKIYLSESKVLFEINNKIITSVSVNERHFYFLTGADKKSFGVANYYFGQKDEKSFLEIFLMDENFAVSFYKKLSFFYEEPFPKILQISANKIALLTPADGKLKIIDSKFEKDFELIKDSEDEFFQERIGHLIIHNGSLVASVSQIRKKDNLVSRFYSINLNTLELNQIEIDIDIIHKIFEVDSKLYFSGVDIEPTMQTGFYLLEIDKNNFKESKVFTLSDILIEGVVKNEKGILFSNNCFYKLLTNKLEKLNFCASGENLIDAAASTDKIFAITRESLNSNLYVFNRNFEILSKEKIETYLTNPELKIYPSGNLVLTDKNKFILMKSILEE